jgi:hypothetical protein
MGWTIGVLRFDSRQGMGIFLFATASRTALRPTQPPIQWVPGALSLEVKRPRREADHFHLVPMWKNTWSYTFTPPIRLHGMVLLLPTSLCLPFHFCDLCVWNFITMASSYPFAAFYGAKRPTVEEHHTVFWDRSLHLSKFGGGVVLQPPPLPRSVQDENVWHLATVHSKVTVTSLRF